MHTQSSDEDLLGFIGELRKQFKFELKNGPKFFRFTDMLVAGVYREKFSKYGFRKDFEDGALSQLRYRAVFKYKILQAPNVDLPNLEETLFIPTLRLILKAAEDIEERIEKLLPIVPDVAMDDLPILPLFMTFPIEDSEALEEFENRYREFIGAIISNLKKLDSSLKRKVFLEFLKKKIDWFFADEKQISRTDSVSSRNVVYAVKAIGETFSFIDDDLLESKEFLDTTFAKFFRSHPKLEEKFYFQGEKRDSNIWQKHFLGNFLLIPLVIMGLYLKADADGLGDLSLDAQIDIYGVG